MPERTDAGNSIPASISVNNGNGDVYVAGASQTTLGGPYDYLIVRYNSTGVQQWEKRQDGNMGLNDYACAVSYFSEDTFSLAGSAHTNPPGVLCFVTFRYSNFDGITPVSTNTPVLVCSFAELSESV